MKLLLSWHILCTHYNHAPCHFMQSPVCKVHVCLVVPCHLHVWQNDWDCFCATAVTQGWNGYQNKCQHRKLTIEKIIFPLLLRRLKPRTFQSRVQCSNHWAIPTPQTYFEPGLSKKKKKKLFKLSFTFVGEHGGERGKQIGSMNEESQVRGCYNITFIYTNQKQRRLSPESDTLVPRQQLKLNDLLLQGHWGKEVAAGQARKF